MARMRARKKQTENAERGGGNSETAVRKHAKFEKYEMLGVFISYSMAVGSLDSLIPLEKEEKPSNIPGGICRFK